MTRPRLQRLMSCAWLLTCLASMPALGAGSSASATAAEVQFVTIGYHDVRDNLARHYDPDQYAVTAEHLAGHFRWLAGEGYTVISIDDVLAARRGERQLPEKSVLLTFDDGFRSVYTHVFPLLKSFGYPAVVSPVTSWIETEKTIPYNREMLDASHFLTWDQLWEMAGIRTGGNCVPLPQPAFGHRRQPAG